MPRTPCSAGTCISHGADRVSTPAPITSKAAPRRKAGRCSQRPTRTPDREAVYFDLFSAHLVTYRASLALPLAIGVAALALLGLGMALLRKRLSALELMQGTGVVLGALVLAVLAGRIAAWLLGPTPLGTPSPLWAWVALLAAGVAGATGLLAVARRTSPLATLAGTTELWVTLAVAISALAPGASHVFAWPALVLAAGLLAAVRDAEPARAAMPAAFVTAVFWVPLMHVLQVMVGASMGPAVTLPATMLVTACAPALVALGGRARWVSPALALVVTVVAIAAWRL